MRLRTLLVRRCVVRTCIITRQEEGVPAAHDPVPHQLVAMCRLGALVRGPLGLSTWPFSNPWLL